jgi:hypothetical protein
MTVGMSEIDDRQSVVRAIAHQLRGGDGPLAQAMLDEDGRAYLPWYSRLLSTLTYLVETEEDVVFGQLGGEGEAGPVRGVLVTKRFVAAIEMADHAAPEAEAVVRAVPRGSIASIDVSVEHGVDIKGSHRYEWPGNVTLSIEYQGLDQAIVVRGPGVDPYRNDRPSPIRALTRALSEDLAGDRGDV